MRPLKRRSASPPLPSRGSAADAAAMEGSAAGLRALWVSLAVLAGTAAARYLTSVPLKLIAGIGFLVIGALSIADYYRG